MAQSIVNCKTSCAAGMQAAFHIERAWLLLNAAHGTHELSGKIYRDTLAVAMRSLGDAATSLQVWTRRPPMHTAVVQMSDVKIAFDSGSPRRPARWLVVTTDNHPTPGRTISAHATVEDAETARSEIVGARLEVSSHG
jgi:hypothetical protein